ncbi:MAG: DNA mismatch repair protein MutT [Flavobacteriaceae bacterium]|nr:MAG: DNA mismatch repair protein MutT [Flavobacteriaceae bacterium]
MNTTNTSVEYIKQEKFLVAVDCIIFGFDSESIKLLLFKRRVEPLKGSLSLIGSFIKNNLNLNDSAKQVLEESTGLKDIFLKELRTYSNLDRDPGNRVISVAHYALIRINELDIKNVEEYDARWYDFNDIPDLIFDHRQMVDDAIGRLRDEARREPICFNLLPEEFTIPQLQSIYECFYQKNLDSRNFRKKILSFDILTKTDRKDKSSSKKGAYLYVYDKEKFDDFIAKGNRFQL